MDSIAHSTKKKKKLALCIKIFYRPLSKSFSLQFWGDMFLSNILWGVNLNKWKQESCHCRPLTEKKYGNLYFSQLCFVWNCLISKVPSKTSQYSPVVVLSFCQCYTTVLYTYHLTLSYSGGHYFVIKCKKSSFCLIMGEIFPRNKGRKLASSVIDLKKFFTLSSYQLQWEHLVQFAQKRNIVIASFIHFYDLCIYIL